MSVELLQAAAGVGTIGAAIWLWRLARVALLFKVLSITALLTASLTLLGVVTVELHAGRIVELVELVVGLW